jgi:hypothetical protein
MSDADNHAAIGSYLKLLTDKFLHCFPDLVSAGSTCIVAADECNHQRPHRDIAISSEYQQHLDRGGSVPLSVLVALQSQTTLRVWRASHLPLTQDPIKMEVITIPPYNAIVFRQDLIHAGDSFVSMNIRIHMFLDPLEYKSPWRREDGMVGKLSKDEKKGIVEIA